MRRFWLHLTIGFLISAVGLWIFLGVTEDVLHHDPLTQFDVTLVDWFQAHHGPAADQVFRAITALGSPLVLITVALGVAVFLVISKQSLLLNGWLLAFAGGALLNNVRKRESRSQLEFPKRPRHGFADWIWDAGVLADHSRPTQPVGALRDRRLHRVAGPRDRIEPSVPRRALLQRRGGRLRGRLGLAFRVHLRARGHTPERATEPATGIST